MTDQSDDPVLYPPDTRSADEKAFLKDLRAAYDNPEIYGDPGVPQIYKLRIWSYLLPDHPTMIRAELDGDVLPNALIEAMFRLVSQDPNLSTTLKKHGDVDFAEFRRQAEEEEGFAAWQKAQWEFFLRHFPKFLHAAYATAFLSAFIATGLTKWREEPDEGLNEFESLARTTLEQQIASFQKMIKEIVGTRSSGRPKRIESTRGLPEVVSQVINTALSIMGDERGENAVPGLKQIANVLNLSSEALGKQLKRAYYPWQLSIKPYLDALPPPDKKSP